MKNMRSKKVLTKFAVLFALIILAGLTLVGCGGNKGSQGNGSADTPKEEPLVFNECLELTEATAYNDTSIKPAEVTDLVNFAKYKTVTFTAKKDFSFYRFGYKMSYQKPQENALNKKIVRYFETTQTTIDQGYGYEFEDTPRELSLNYYYRKVLQNGKHTLEFVVLENLNVPSTAEKIKFIKGEQITLKFTQDPFNHSDGTEYNTPISLSNFTIE